MAGRRVAILHDSTGFGGHEIAFLQWLPALVASPLIEQIDFWIYQNNTTFLKAVEELSDPKIRVTLSAFHKGPGETLRAPLRFRYGRAAARFIRETGADIVLLLQGRIESLSTPALWLPVETDLVSYIPMAHSSAEMGRPSILARLLDRVKLNYYSKPKRFITISTATAAQLIRAGVKAPIYVVENVPSRAGDALIDQTEARRALGLDPQSRIALFMGRFDTQQKGLDNLLRDLRLNAHSLDQWTFLFVGDGPAEQVLQDFLSETRLNGRVIKWTLEPQTYMAACDIVLMPSRFEGVPLVLLDALHAQKAVLASDIDVFKEYLPSFMLNNFDIPVDISARLLYILADTRQLAYKEHAEYVVNRLTTDLSQKRFLLALLNLEGAEPVPTRNIKVRHLS